MLSKIAEFITKNDKIWSIIDKVIVLTAKRLSSARLRIIDKKITDQHSKNGVVSGPFKGLHYNEFQAIGSTLYPKLLGTYEKEIQNIITDILKTNYSYILDVGCAEGYYAVGFALKGNSQSCYAYDINEEARLKCKKMAEENGVKDKIKIEKSCTAKTLNDFDFSKKSFIFCDTDGYEKELFTEECINNLVNCDLLIETHDCFVPNVTDYLINLFKKTHQITHIKQVPDDVKAREYLNEVFAENNYEINYRYYREGRPKLNEWLYLQSK